MDDKMRKLRAKKMLRESWRPSDPENFKEFVESLQDALVPLGKLKLDRHDIESLSNEVFITLNAKTKFQYIPPIQVLVEAMMSDGKLKYDLDAAFDAVTLGLKKIYTAVQKLGADPLRYVYSVTLIINDFVTDYSGKETAEPESPPGQENPKYGKYLFAPQRKNQVPFEWNTGTEEKVYQALLKHVSENEPMNSDAALELMQDLEDGAYSKILHEPQAEIVYRGIALDRDALATMLGKPEFPDTGELKVSKFISSRPGGKEGSTAWTTVPAAVKKFTVAYPGAPYSVVLYAKRSENPHTFLEGPGGFYKVPSLGVLKHEEESIALGPVRVYKIAWEKHKFGSRETSWSDVYSGEIKEVTERVLSRLLREVDLGSVQFSSKRSDGARRDEPNTPDEVAVERQISSWLEWDGDLRGPGGADDLKTLMSDPRYSKFFKGPPGDADVFRGVSMFPAALAAALGVSPENLGDKGEAEGSYVVPLRRDSAGASWTLEEQAAEQFAKLNALHDKSDDVYCVVWTADPNENPGALLDLGSILRRTQNDPDWKVYRDEWEVVALAPIKAHSVRWWKYKKRKTRSYT